MAFERATKWSANRLVFERASKHWLERTRESLEGARLWAHWRASVVAKRGTLEVAGRWVKDRAGWRATAGGGWRARDAGLRSGVRSREAGAR